MEPLSTIKERYRIEDAWRDEGFEGRPSKCGRSPFRGDSKPSFSVFADGTQFKDHATGETGDVISFLQLAQKCSFEEAVKVAKSRAGLSPWARDERKPYQVRPKQTRTNRFGPLPKAEAMTGEIAELWQRGVERLLHSPTACANVDRWRGWPEGTTERLTLDGRFSAPTIGGKAGLAFAVHSPAPGGLLQTGFHFRSKDSGRWQFYPNEKMHGRSIRPLPFILGHGHLTKARTVIITEGQWDSIAWASWIGWLAHETAWPTGVVTMGVLGASNWRTVFEAFRWPSMASVLLIPDNDPAGNRWKEGFLDELKLRSAKVHVVQPTESDLTDQIKQLQHKQDELFSIFNQISMCA